MALIAIMAGVAVACAPASRTDLPDGAASFAGHIASRHDSTLMLVADGVQPAGADRAAVRIHAGTRLRFASGEAATNADLQVGRRVRAWFDGPVRESYPVQASAGTILIESP